MAVNLFCSKSKVTPKGGILANGTSPDYLHIFIGRQ